MSKSTLIGPFTKDQHAQFDETHWIFDQICDGEITQTMIDVGAHLGNVFKPFASAEWIVHAIEPYQPHYETLSLRYPNHQNVFLHKVAISDSPDKMIPFYASYESSGINSLTPFRPSHRKVDEVETTTLAHLIEKGSIDRVDFLKIDTEGHDLMALKGFPWNQFKPRIILCEFENAKSVPLGYKMEDMASFLESKGYAVLMSEWHPIARYGIPHDWRALRELPASLANSSSWGNLIAIRDPMDASALIEKANAYCSFHDDTLVAKSIHGANPEQDGKVLSALLSGMRVVLFGAGGSGQIALRSLRKISCEIVCFADNDAQKHGSQIEEIPVMGPQDLSSQDFDLILIASDYAQDIYRELISIGMPDEKIRIFHVSIGLEGNED